MLITRDKKTGLWRAPLRILDRPTHQSNNIHKVNDKDNAIKYLHVTAFSPVQYTWEKSFNQGYFNRWPGITEKYINKMPKAESTIKGHLTNILIMYAYDAKAI